MTNDLFFKKKRNLTIGIVILAGIYLLAARGTDFHLSALLDVPKGFVWLFENFRPTQASLARLPLILKQLLKTMLMAVTATTTAAALALLMAVIGSRQTGINAVTKTITRMIASLFRNMPVVVWAMILLLSFKQSEFTGYLAIFMTTFGYLTRSFMETIDETSSGTIEALTATGASYFQIIFQGVIPMVSSQLISWMLFMVENNIRDATLVGILTGTGIGFIFDLFYKRFQYDVAGMTTLSIIIVVILIEMLSNRVRRMIL